MKILIIGNHTCGNRGDGAIIRGLIEEVEEQQPGVNVDVMSRFPVSSEFLLGKPFIFDWIYKYQRFKGGLKAKLQNRIYKSTLKKHLVNSAESTKIDTRLPQEFKDYIKSLKEYDYVIQVGGSFFVDLYGVGQFYHALCTLASGTPLLILGHSVGPFENKEFCDVSKLVFNRAKVLALRESVSKDLLEEKFELPRSYYEGADTAWLVRSNHVAIENAALIEFVESENTIAITLRELKPFDKRLGISQDLYEDKYAEICNHLIRKGFNILACSTCTGIDGYQKDDRMVALRVQKKIDFPEKFKVVLDELNDVQLGTLLSKCQLTIGTRLHSAIISMNFGTPAFALNYEHKSEGIMNQLGLPSFGTHLSELVDGSLINKVDNCLADLVNVRGKVHCAVENEKSRARNMISLSFK